MKPILGVEPRIDCLKTIALPFFFAVTLFNNLIGGDYYLINQIQSLEMKSTIISRVSLFIPHLDCEYTLTYTYFLNTHKKVYIHSNF